MELSWSTLIANSIDPSARSLHSLGRDDNLIGLVSRVRHHVISRPSRRSPSLQRSPTLAFGVQRLR